MNEQIWGWQLELATTCLWSIIFKRMKSIEKDILQIAPSATPHAVHRLPWAGRRGRQTSCESTCSPRPGRAPPGCTWWAGSGGWPARPPSAAPMSAADSCREEPVWLCVEWKKKQLKHVQWGGWTSDPQVQKQPKNDYALSLHLDLVQF